MSPSSGEGASRWAIAWLVAGFVVHGAWALTVPGPLDWDAAYYRDVALTILRGEGARSGAAWMASLATGPLPVVADLHWMPLPSRALLPGLYLWPSRGDQLVTVIFAALWAPVAVALTRALGGGRPAQISAGIFAVAAGGYARFLSTPDVFALQGLLGALGWLAVWRGRAGAAAAVAAAVALCRGDGFLFGIALGLGIGGRGGLLVASAGCVATGAWGLRSLLVAPELALDMRAAALRAPTMAALLAGDPRSVTLLERLTTLGRELPQAAATGLLAGGGLLPVLAALGALGKRRDRRLWAAVAYLIGMPSVTLFLTPAIASSGTPFRSGAALFVLGAALGGLGLVAADGWLARARGWRPGVLRGMGLVGFVVASVGLGLAQRAARPAAPIDCAPLHGLPVGAVVLTGRPLLVRAVCGPAAAWLGPDEAPEVVAARAVAVGARYALLPERDADPSVPVAAMAPALLPGWVAGGGGLFVAPTP